MNYRGLDSSRGPFAPTLALSAALLLTPGLPPAAAGDVCATGPAGLSTSCETAWDLAQDLARRRSERSLAANPSADRVNRLRAGAAQNGESVMPFAVSGDDNKIDFKTSLTQWGTALSAADLELLKQARSTIADAALPQAVKPRAPKLDLWAQGRREHFGVAGANQGNALTTYVGADYLWSRDLLIGGMMQFDDSHRTILAAPGASFGTAYMGGPYIAYRLSPNLIVDAKAAWGMAYDSVVAGSESANIAADRMLTEARLTGNWQWKAWRLSQSGALTHLNETAHGGIAAPSASPDVTRISLGPELKHHFGTGNGASIEPFAFFKSSLNLAESDWNAPVGQNTVGGGVLLAKPDKYNIRAAADYTGTTSGTGEVATGKLSVSVPSSLFGF